MIGVVVNTLAVLVGGLIGMTARRAVPERVTDAIMKGIGLCTVYIGITGALKGENTVILIVSIVLGSALGTVMDIDGKINALGEYAQRRYQTRAREDKQIPIAQGLITASLLFCVGSMTIVGSINAGLSGDNTMLYTKSALDFISAIMLTVSLGAGVMLSGVIVLLFQGSLVLLAQILQPMITNPGMLAEMNCAGSVLIIGLGLNLLGVTRIKVADYLPAIIIAPVISYMI